MGESRVSARVVYVATALTIAAFVGGVAMAGSLTITSGASESAGGNFESTSGISWWTQSSVGLSSTPSPTPTALSTSPSSPTVLSSAQGYLLNTGTSGDVAHYFKMTESSGAPASTELEIVFTISTGATPSLSTVVVYLETQSTSPSASVTVTIYYDLGSATSGTIVLNSVQQISQVCGSVGTCP